jgi:hypothetical protein
MYVDQLDLPLEQPLNLVDSRLDLHHSESFYHGLGKVDGALHFQPTLQFSHLMIAMTWNFWICNGLGMVICEEKLRR